MFGARTPRVLRPAQLCNRPFRSVSCQAAFSEAPAAPPQPDSEQVKPPRRKRVLSGVQPTGNLHLGNYCGAVKNWVPLQEDYDTFFCVVDLHAITMPHDPKALRESSHATAAAYIAAGVDPSKSSIFMQSHVAGHSELTWLLGCYTPIGWLERMIQFKEKSRKQGESVNSGLLTYPTLMAADILLYQSELVPVGEDQKQHLELSRNIAERFNGLFGGRKWKKMDRRGRGGQLFRVPEVLTPPAGARVMSLQDGTSKMSKSAENDNSRINMTDDPKLIIKKIKSAKTDAESGLEWDNPDRPECQNLLTIYSIVTGKGKDEIASEVSDMSWGQFKPVLADAVVEHLGPFQSRYNEVMNDRGQLDIILKQGADSANEVANVTVERVRDAMGFLPPSANE